MDKKEEKVSCWFGVIVVCIVLAMVILLISFAVCCHMAFAGVDTSRAVIHHTDSHDVSVVEIDRWHKERGWSGVGYHYVIRKNGDIEVGRPLAKNGAHALGRNQFVGIVLTGRNTFTKAQYNSLTKLIKRLGIETIEPHHEECPGTGFNFYQIGE